MVERFPATLLVPGWSDTADALRHAQRFLIDEGWPADRVMCLEFRDRYGSNVEHAVEVAAAVEALRARTGVPRVAVLAHSMGGLAVRQYLATAADPAPVSRVLFAGTPHRGTWTAWLAWGPGGAEMRPGSAFLRKLNQAALPAHVTAVCIRTPLDTRVVPGSSAVLAGAACHVVRLPTHPRMLRHRPTLRLICDLLRET